MIKSLTFTLCISYPIYIKKQEVIGCFSFLLIHNIESMNLRSFWQINMTIMTPIKLTINQSLYVEKMSGHMNKNGGLLVAFIR